MNYLLKAGAYSLLLFGACSGTVFASDFTGAINLVFAVLVLTFVATIISLWLVIGFLTRKIKNRPVRIAIRLMIALAVPISFALWFYYGFP
ncbi:MAG: hypothetical protein Q8O37_16315 [Sulfuricellaceae bacterium]|nr:hypothetical protein [Sulfuricellaceae bacterium]